MSREIFSHAGGGGFGPLAVVLGILNRRRPAAESIALNIKLQPKGGEHERKKLWNVQYVTGGWFLQE